MTEEHPESAGCIVPLSDYMRPLDISRIDPAFDSEAISGTYVQIRAGGNTHIIVQSVEIKPLANDAVGKVCAVVQRSGVTANRIICCALSGPPGNHPIRRLNTNL